MSTSGRLEVQYIQTAKLSPEEREEIMEVCCEAFGGPFEELFDLVAPTGVHVLGRLEYELVTHAVLTERWFRIGNLPEMRAAYIDAVATLPRLQRRGYGGHIMRKSVRYASGRYDIAALATFRDSWYESLGWDRWMGALALDKDGEIIPTPNIEERVMIRRLPETPEIDVKEMLIASWRPGGGW